MLIKRRHTLLLAGDALTPALSRKREREWSLIRQATAVAKPAALLTRGGVVTSCERGAFP